MRPKMQANSNNFIGFYWKKPIFLLPIILALKQMSFQPFLEGRERN